MEAEGLSGGGGWGKGRDTHGGGMPNCVLASWLSMGPAQLRSWKSSGSTPNFGFMEGMTETGKSWAGKGHRRAEFWGGVAKVLRVSVVS